MNVKQAKEEISIANIEELALVAQKYCYPNIKTVHPIQLAETKQFYLMGFFEGMQIANKMPTETFDKAFNEVKDSIQARILELYKK